MIQIFGKIFMSHIDKQLLYVNKMTIFFKWAKYLKKHLEKNITKWLMSLFKKKNSPS